MSKFCLFLASGFLFLAQIQNTVSYVYGAALTKSLLFFEAQRSGKLPSNQRVKWRGDSGLNDGRDAGLNLVGGYYDAGDNVKYGLPMAYTVTMLAWSVVEFRPHFRARHELSHAMQAIKWGTDYLIKAHPKPDVLYGEVGDGGSDHSCWMRPEDMTTPRTVYKIDDQHPGSDLAGETAAALAAAAIVFRRSNPSYSSQLINHAKQLFEFALNHNGAYQNSIPVALKFYTSSGYEDELLWAAAWLRQATKDKRYLEFIKSANSGGARSIFSWDDKYAGAQVLIAKGILRGKLPRSGNLEQYKKGAEEFICNCIQKGNSNVQRSNAGLLWFIPWSNLQYVTSATFLMTTYADVLAKTKTTIECPGSSVSPQDLLGFARYQVDYILGSNPNNMSYMVGYGSNYPRRVHHRGASIVSIKQNPRVIRCQVGLNEWYHKDADNPNVLEGAVVGGPDQSDKYTDSRDNYPQVEPSTATNAPIVGVLARLAS
ncbi:cellulase [Salvia divinorum]|uniref:Endoglucanase n=1 Tax=Salvia divinorum TaxID=28513 RepID=A0ABD1HS05_SALDI